jgi:hypothetical protein
MKNYCFDNCTDIVLCRLLDASLNATTSPDCSVKMAYVLTNVRSLFLFGKFHSPSLVPHQMLVLNLFGWSF